MVKDAHAPTRRTRGALIFSGLLTAACGVLTLWMSGNPLHLKHFPPMFVALVASTTVSATVMALLLPTNWIVRGAVAGVCCVCGAAFAAILGYGASTLNSSGRVAMRVVSPDGRYTLVSVEGRALTAIDSQYDVLLISGKSVLARESLVWRGIEEGAAPTSMRFVGPDEIEVTTDDGCSYRSTFYPVTMAVRPVWKETHSRAGCASPR